MVNANAGQWWHSAPRGYGRQDEVQAKTINSIAFFKAQVMLGITGQVASDD
jgi:hypothetical protein